MAFKPHIPDGLGWAYRRVSNFVDPTGVSTGIEIALETGLNDYNYSGCTQQIEEGNKQAKAELAQAKANGVSNSDELLRCGLGGLKFFDQFLPLYNQWKGTLLELERDIYREYSKLGGIDFTAFHRDAEMVSQVSSTMRDVYSGINSEITGLVSHWKGEASVAASNNISKLLDSGHRLQEGVTSLGSNLKHHVKAVETVIRLCSESALDIYDTKCGGYTPPELRVMIDAARNQSGILGLDINGFLSDYFQQTILKVIESVDSKASSDVIKTVMDEVTGFFDKKLTKEFVPAFEARLHKFQDVVCKKTTDDVYNLWKEFLDSTRRISDGAFSEVPPILSN